MNKTFLSEILGSEGAAALEKAVDRAPLLKSVLVPRTVISWLSTVGRLGFEGPLPGINESYFALIKTENEGLYSGALTIDNELHTFEKSDLLHVAGAVGVALGLDFERIDDSLKTKDLTSLGKSIDVLVKSQIISKIKRNKKLKKDDEMAGAPGPAHAPTGPKAPTTPVAPQKTQSVPATAKKPSQKPNIALGQGQTQLKVTKSESQKPCHVCGERLFKNNDFHGCFCLADLSKSVKVSSLDDGFLLTFNKLRIDEDAISTVISTFKD